MLTGGSEWKKHRAGWELSGLLESGEVWEAPPSGGVEQRPKGGG